METVKIKIWQNGQELILKISALDSDGNAIPVTGSISNLRIFGNKMFIPNNSITNEQELIIEHT
jgi:hypothetical protein